MWIPQVFLILTWDLLWSTTYPSVVLQIIFLSFLFDALPLALSSALPFLSSFFAVFDYFDNFPSIFHSDTDGFCFVPLSFSRCIQRLCSEFKARFLYLASLISHTTISTHLLNTLLLAKASFLGRHPNLDLKTSSNEKFTNLKLWQSSITLTDYKKRIPYLSFLSGFLSQVLVLSVTFPDKLEKFCCSRHLSYDTHKHFSSSADLLHLPHLLLYGSEWFSIPNTFFLMSQIPPKALTCCPPSPRCPGDVWFTYTRTYGGLSEWCAGAVNPLCRPDTGYLGVPSDRNLHTLPKGYISPRSSFCIPPKSEASHASRKRGSGKKICRGHMWMLLNSL